MGYIIRNDIVYDSKNDDIIAEKFSETKSYTKDSFCIYGLSLYKFTENKSAGPWDPSKVEVTMLVNELGNNFVLPIASTTVLGGVKVDGETIKAETDGTISSFNKVVELTLAEYNALPVIDPQTTYYITDVDNVLASPVAETFSTSKAYSIGDYCMYNNYLYKFTSAKSAGAWDISKVTTVLIMDEIKAGSSYTLPVASEDTLGGVKIDGTSIKINNAVISGASKTSDLVNDSNFASDANYVHTDNNYSNTEKTKLAGIAEGAEVNVQSDWSVSDNTSDAFIKNKPTSLPASDVYDWAKAATKPTYNATEVGAIDSSLKGASNGVAELGEDGKVPSSQLPSYVDDVLEFDSFNNFPAVGEAGKIYVAKDTNKTYRWGGTSYVEISASLALGETSATAYRGDRGKAAYDHSQDANKLSTSTAAGFFKVGATAEGHISELSSVSKSDITALGIPGDEYVLPTATTTTLGGVKIDGTSIKINNAVISGASKTSDLTNDSNFAVDANYVHTDNNYSNADKSKLTMLPDVINQNWQGNGYNLIPFPYASGTNRTHNGITYRADSDGKISVVSGTASSNSNYSLLGTNNNYKLKAGNYKIITNCNKSESTSTYDMWMGIRRDSDLVYVKSQQVIGSYDFTITEEEATTCHICININVLSGNSADGVYWKPMIVEVDSNGNYPTEYQRYASSNVKLTDALDNKVDKVSGKGLSTNDYTTTEKNKLSGIASGAEVNVQSDWNVTDSSSDAFIKNKPTIPPAITVDTSMSSSSTNAVQNKVIKSYVDTGLSNKVDNVSGKGLSTNDYTTTEKNKLSGIASGAEVNVQSDWNVTDSSSDAFIKNKPTIPPAITVDTSMSDSSTNAVQNKVIKSYVDSGLSNKVDNTDAGAQGLFSQMTYDLATTISDSNKIMLDTGNSTSPWKHYGLSTFWTWISNKVKSICYTKDETDTALSNKMDNNNPVGTGSFSLNRKSDTTIGTDSFAEGYYNTASGNYSHAEGSGNTASGNQSHAEGNSTTASGPCSHAEGYFTTASGDYSHAEGMSAIVSGDYSHAEGYYIKASSNYQHVQGKYNVEDSSSKYADIVGWGSSTSNRANIETTDTNGVKWLKSDVRCGGTDQDDTNAISLTNLNTKLSEVNTALGNKVDNYHFKVNVSTTGNWNDYQKTGVYSGVGLSNRPADVGAETWLSVLSMADNDNSGYGNQLANCNGKLYLRNRNGSWKKVVDSDHVDIALSAPTSISLSKNSMYYHATRAAGTGMEIKIPLVKTPKTVTGSNLQYYDNNAWNNTAISSWYMVGASIVITFTNIPSNTGIYGMQGTLTLTY